MGKTSLVLNMAQHVGTKTDMTVGVFSLEMSKEQLFLRLLTAEARIDAHRLRGGFLGERDWGRLSQAIGTLSEAKIFIDDTPSIGVLEMRAKCRRLDVRARPAPGHHRLHPADAGHAAGSRTARSSSASISRSLKGLAKELSVPIVVLSQLSRAPESRSDHRPQLSDLRESGALEQDADVVMFIYREDQYADKSQPPADDAGRRRADHRQAAQRPDRRRQARVHPRVHAVRESRAGQLTLRATECTSARAGADLLCDSPLHSNSRDRAR